MCLYDILSSEYLVVFNFIRVVAALPGPGVPGDEAVILRLVDMGDLRQGVAEPSFVAIDP